MTEAQPEIPLTEARGATSGHAPSMVQTGVSSATKESGAGAL
jgi:hypothetical protein